MDASMQLVHMGYETKYMTAINSDLATNRNILCTEAIKENSDFIVFCDSDMSFDLRDLFAMIEADKDCIGSSYAGKKIISPELRVTADNARLGDILARVTRPQFVSPEGFAPRNGEIVKVPRVGTGLMVIKTAVLVNLINQGKIGKYTAYCYADSIYDFFHFKNVEQGSTGEDYIFCDFLRENGCEVWLHITDRTLHYGEYGFHLAFK